MIFRVGINDANYVVYPKLNGKQICCPFYWTWKNMLMRCYSFKYLKKQPTYIGCQVCNEWLIFSNFKIWMETQDWQNKQLDKDFLGNGKLYSPETCCFVPSWLNKLFTDSGRKRGKWPIGVSWHKRDKKS